jgi:hypothetical protein
MPDVDLDPDAEFAFDLWDELAPEIARWTNAHERNSQVEIGPSGMGTPCNRKLGYRLMETPPLHSIDPDETDPELIVSAANWRPFVGTCVHLQLAAMLDYLNKKVVHDVDAGGNCREPWCDYLADEEGSQHRDRFEIEFETPVGTIGGKPKNGHVDVYDRLHKTIIDWKIAGPKALKDKHALCHRETDPNPGAEYRVQAHVYARGVRRALHWPVERVAIFFLPMNGELKDGFVWSEPYRPDIAAEAFKRARAIHDRLAERGEEYLAKLKTAPDYCSRCPWFSPGVERATFDGGCPGDKSMMSGLTGFEDLLG